MPREIFETFAGTMGVIVVVYALIPVFPLLYVITRWRAAGKGEPGLGFHAGLLYFRSLSMLVFITGLAMLLHSLADPHSDGRGMESMRRIAGGLLIGGGLFLGLHVVMLSVVKLGTAAESCDRVFRGFLMILSGVASMVLVIVVFVLLLQKDADFDDLRTPLVWTAVWLSVYLLHVRSLGRRVNVQR